ncbi:hypothetical protein [Mesorhizobium shangrilense]|uniref:PEP-CTERM sorting domain-containing protein n=1 Tax=Mesorhizobium shangrilense TaxID=460060 RepID=A0ABV2D6H2_9HYPH
MRISGPSGFSSTRFFFPAGRICPMACLAPLLLAALPMPASAQTVLTTGAYSFSDELGGFHITGASGNGTKDDPFVITEELNSATPVTLTIRAERPIQPFGVAGKFATGMLKMRIDVLNNGGQGWIEFQFELQSILGQPSTDDDGLSFDQPNKTPDYIASSGFADYYREMTPYDRLLFRDGKVDPLKTATFDFLITDLVPKKIFWLVQEPRIPLS